MYKNDNFSNNDKTSFCHFIFHNGVDIDISRKKIFECYDQANNKNFLLFKKSKKIKTLLFIEEHYLYFLKDIIINKNNENLRRINNKYDLNKLFDYKIDKKDKNSLITLDFLHDDNILERILKKIEFEEKEGENFEKYLVDTLQKIDSVFFDEIFGDNDEDDNEGEEEEDEKDEGKNDGEKNEKEDKNENKNVENQEGKNENKIKKIVFKRKNFDEGKDSISSNLKSSSRFVLKKFS